MPDTRRTQRLLLCFGLCSALAPAGARAGWSPATVLRTPVYYARLALEAAEDTDRVLAAVDDGGLILSFTLDERWRDLPALDLSADFSLRDAAFDGRRPLLLLYRARYSTPVSLHLRLARLQEDTWEVSAPLLPLSSRGYPEPTWAALVQLGRASFLLGLETWYPACGSSSADELYATRCFWEDCLPVRRLTPPFLGDLDFPSGPTVVSLGAGPNPEGSVSVFYEPEASESVLEASLPEAANPRPLPAAFSRLLEVLPVSGETEMHALGISESLFGDTLELVWGRRAKGSSRWSSHTQQFEHMGSGTGLSACRIGDNLHAVWGEEAFGIETSLFHATLSGGRWSKEEPVPGTGYCYDYLRCQNADSLTGARAVCTENELHVLWSTSRGGIRHVSWSELDLQSAEARGGEILLHGRGFSGGLAVWLNGHALEVLEVGSRFVRVRPPAGPFQGKLRAENPDGQSAELQLNALPARSGKLAAAAILVLALLLRLGLSPRFARTALLLALGLPFCALAQPPAAEGIAVQAGLTAKGEKRLLLVRPGDAAEPLTLVGPAISPFVGSRTADVAEIDAASCRTTRLWASAAEFLDAVRHSGANSVFCFAHNPWLPGEPEPLTGDPGRGEAAMAPDFVERLRSFGRECDRRGLVLQIAFFEHISVRHAAFQGLPSPLLPWLHAELERQGQPVDPMALTAAFFRHTGKGPDGLSPIGRLQRAWIRALVQALPAASVVYEPVHEPRYRNNPYLEQRDVLAWQDWALGQIREAECDFGLPRHVLAVSPDPHGPRDGNHVVMEDLVAWREMQRHGVLPNFAQLDLVIVHGQPFFGKDLGAALHRRQLARSLGPFLRRFPELAFELSTDGLNGRSHFAPGAPCGGEDRGLSQLRHGVWGPVPTRAGPAEVYPLVWAQSVLEMDRAWGPGRVHFNNWSPTAASIDQIGQVFGRREEASRP